MTYKSLKKTLLIWGIELEFYVEGIECDLFLDNVQKKISWFKFYCEKETSINQYEIKSCCYDNFNVLTRHFKCVKEILIETSHSLGGHISFHAKPYLNRAGSALNVHVNLIALNSNNLFYISNNKCSDYLFYSVGGLCFVMKKYMQYFAPNNESYLRFKYPDIHTPTTISWGVNNRTAAIRIIPHPICRLEHRIPGADCDLREVLEAIVEGISFGIENKIAPPKRVYGIASDPQYKMEKLI